MKIGRTVVALLAAAWLIGPVALPQLDAGVVSYIKLDPFTADADSGIDPANFYTHSLDFGTGAAATVNGVPFTQVTLGNIDAIPGFSYTVNTSGRNHHGGNANTGVDAGQGQHQRRRLRYGHKAGRVDAHAKARRIRAGS